MSAQVNGDGFVTWRKVRDLTIPVGQTAAETVHENNWVARRTGDDVMDQGHWTVPFIVFPPTPNRFSRRRQAAGQSAAQDSFRVNRLHIDRY